MSAAVFTKDENINSHIHALARSFLFVAAIKRLRLKRVKLVTTSTVPLVPAKK